VRVYLILSLVVVIGIVVGLRILLADLSSSSSSVPDAEALAAPLSPAPSASLSLSVAPTVSWSPTASNAPTIEGILWQADFDRSGDSEGLAFETNVFRNTTISSTDTNSIGTVADGALQIRLISGNSNRNDNTRLSAAWQRRFTLRQATAIVLQFRYRMTLTTGIVTTSSLKQQSQVMASINGEFNLLGLAPYDAVAHLASPVGDGNNDTDWRTFRIRTGSLTAGTQTLALGGYSTAADSVTAISLDDVQLLVDDDVADDPTRHAHQAVDRLTLQGFMDNIETLSGFGDRLQGSSSYFTAAAWVEAELVQVSYTIERAPYTYRGEPRNSIYVTKVGTLFPDRMFVVSAHLDGRGNGGAADDDGSGCSLVLEIARVLSSSDITIDVSVRMIFWNNEESGLDGSRAYAIDRLLLQGREDPPGSGIYPEPTWLGIIQHDMILFDHGLPPQGQ